MKTVHFLCFTKKILLWRNRHEQSVRTQTMKIVMYTMEPRLRVSSEARRAGFFLNCLLIRRGGDPSGGGGNHRKWKNV